MALDPLTAVLNVGQTLIDKFFPDPAEKAKATLQLAKMEQDGELTKLSTRMSAIIAEAQSSDKWTSRARPSFMYVIYIMILFGIPIGILSAFHPDVAIQITDGMNAYLRAIPKPMWTTFQVGYLGYSTVRTIDKRKK
jgi:hypothetical protein